MQVPHPSVRQGTEEASVTPLELFFDLVFVFALTQVTAFMADDLTWNGMLRGVLIVMLLWWSWIGYAWLANVASPDQATMKALMLVAMAAMFLIALCIPEAFDDGPGGLLGPLVLALCYLVFRLMHLGMFFYLAGDDDMLKRQLLRFTPSVFGATILLVIASPVHGLGTDPSLGRRPRRRLRGHGDRGEQLAAAGAGPLRRAARLDLDRRPR